MESTPEQLEAHDVLITAIINVVKRIATDQDVLDLRSVTIRKSEFTDLCQQAQTCGLLVTRGKSCTVFQVVIPGNGGEYVARFVYNMRTRSVRMHVLKRVDMGDFMMSVLPYEIKRTIFNM